MPQTEVVFFRDEAGRILFYDWMRGLPRNVQDKLYIKVERLAECGFDLRRPEADYLRNGIHELRCRHGRVNYRILYFYRGKVAVISHGCTKEGEVPDREIDHAIANRILLDSNPEKHSSARKKQW